jgi:hypothetical protein
MTAVIGYAGGGQPRGLYAVDTGNGSANFITAVDYFLATGGLAYLNGSLYATNFTTSPGTIPPDTYGLLDPIDGSFTPLGTQTSANWFGLAANKNSNFLYVMDIEDPILRKFIPGGAIETIGSGLGLEIQNGIRGMAYDDRNGILYATDYYDADANLYTIDTITGLATLVGSLGLQVAFLGRIFEKRHPITHNLGVVDRKYMEKARTAEREGREVLISTREIEQALDLSMVVFRTLHGRLFPQASTAGESSADPDEARS